jgi:hypothetical protein
MESLIESRWQVMGDTIGSGAKLAVDEWGA